MQSGRHVRATRSSFVSSIKCNGIVCSRQLRGPSRTLSRRFALLPVRSSKEDLEKQLDHTQTTLDRVLQQIAASQPQSNGNISDAALSNREQQLWERQQSLLDRLQHHWDLERQAWLQEKASWHEREYFLLKELSSLRSELQAIVTKQAAAAAGSHSAGSSSSSSRPGMSDLAASAVINTVISGPSSASAAVADAIRAVRDAHARPPPRDLSSSSNSSSGGSSSSSNSGVDLWQDLFSSHTAASSSSSSALASVDAAIAAADDADMLSDLSTGSSSGGKRKVDTAAAAAGPSSSSSGPIETTKSDPAGPPPLLAIGDDDIYWISKLHNALMTAGFYPSNEEIENWVFAEGTQSALLTFQACNGVSETGTTCESTWRKLLGEDHYETTYGSSSSSSSTTISAPAAVSSSNGGSSSSDDVVIVEEESETVMYSFSDVGSGSSSSSAARSDSSSSSSSSSGGTWPVLMDMDGGRAVHALQVSLDKAGFFCGDDEMRWWQFGSSTQDALKTFQACNSLPESGVCDERTWLTLLGSDAKPEDVDLVHGDESAYEDDMTAEHEGAVWLLGEQRWSRPVNGNNS